MVPADKLARITLLFGIALVVVGLAGAAFDLMSN
jgi:hypothetical protein